MRVLRWSVTAKKPLAPRRSMNPPRREKSGLFGGKDDFLLVVRAKQLPPSSWPALCGPSSLKPSGAAKGKLDGPDEPGHDSNRAGSRYSPVFAGTGGASRISKMESRRLALALGSSGSKGSDPALPATS